MYLIRNIIDDTCVCGDKNCRTKEHYTADAAREEYKNIKGVEQYRKVEYRWVEEMAGL